ncbi:hypothetical protein PILCRDRAFT_826647 [Piloderma croceum F 1598]|uniref:Uncharacterized protein n=1 Tax=Piloderma croceum (strain F 1598) TaxID=765440 RepID=A0A0C3AQG2_PILCF|nr:hypothetical protein PILCRDRAFT_826647 [Piloderma croceum F 1598]
MGFAPVPKTTLDAPATGANAITSIPKADSFEASRTLEKEEKRRRKLERKEEKRAKKEARRSERVTNGYDSKEEAHRRQRDRTRSRSPRGYQPRDSEPYHSRHSRRRSRTPPARDLRFSPHRISDYNATERERERDRRGWARRDERD